jgi:hypothetical protein
MTIRRTHLTLALAALAAAVLYNVWYFVLRPSGPAPARPAAEQPLIVPGGAAPGADAARDPLSIPAPPAIDLTSAPSWRRDPFLFGDETRFTARAAAPAAAPALPVVRTILFSDRRRLAIVDGRIVGVGETVGAYTVVDIEKGAVVLAAPSGERLRVLLHGPAPVEPVR